MLWVALIITPLFCQLLKFITCDDMNLENLFRTGGMPSGHSALTSCLATISFIQVGWTLPTWICVVLWLLIFRDATGVRLAVGRDEDLLEKLAKKHHVKTKIKHVRGHTSAQAWVGTSIGIITTLFIHLVL